MAHVSMMQPSLLLRHFALLKTVLSSRLFHIFYAEIAIVHVLPVGCVLFSHRFLHFLRYI